jgi:hypothetical protein
MNGKWKHDKQKRGSVQVERDEVKQKKGRGGEKVEKKNNATIIKCGGTLTVIYQWGGNHTFKIGKAHKSTVGQGDSRGPDNKIPMAVIMPNISWGVWRDNLIQVKEELVKLGERNWNNLNGCKKECQYLPGLCTTNNLERWKT